MRNPVCLPSIQNVTSFQTVSRPWRMDIVDSVTCKYFLFSVSIKEHVHLQIRHSFSRCRASYIIPSLQYWHVARAAVKLSAWLLRLIDNAREMIYQPPSRIHYCYGEYQLIFNKYPQVQFHEGLPELSNEAFDSREPTLMIVDDLMSETNQLVANIFTKLSHHRNISIL